MFVRIKENMIVNADLVGSATFNKAEGDRAASLELEFIGAAPGVGTVMTVTGDLAVEGWNLLAPHGKQTGSVKTGRFR